ncbi:MAG: GPW/gp25 family protein [Pseudobacteriovorax sp.]|nr:GPW/gp25 family protein [Pseudobacteriovorax sp.]
MTQFYGADFKTGERIEEIEAVRQSIRDVLATPVGSRVMNREYGSRLFELLDSPISETIDYYRAANEALFRFEPRFELKTISIKPGNTGAIRIEVRGVFLPTSAEIRDDFEI